MVVNRSQLADVLGIDIRSVKNFVDDGMPKLARGKYELGACVKWFVEHEREKARAGKGLNDLDLARQRKTIAEARKAELELEALEGNVIPLDMHEQRLEGITTRLAAQCKGLDRFIADVQRATTTIEAKSVVDAMSDALLASLQRVSDDLPVEPVADDDRAERTA
jgi:phage terminase Nu1 subunit (DNA packaging protein)